MQIAYLDPASGSLIATVLVGGTAAVGVAVKTARLRLTGAFRKSSAEDEVSTDESSDQDAAVESDA